MNKKTALASTLVLLLAFRALVELGYTDVWNLDGGMIAWEASGRLLQNDNN